MKILVVSLQKLAGTSLQFRHALVEVIKETRTSYRVEPVAAVDGRTYIRKEEVDKVQIETDGVSITAFVLALNESESLSTDLLRYWKREVKTGLMRFLKRQNQELKQTYEEAINI